MKQRQATLSSPVCWLPWQVRIMRCNSKQRVQSILRWSFGTLFVLEFLDLPEQRTYSERDLESAIIDRLEHFLLALGKGFLFEVRQKRFAFDDDHRQNSQH